MTPKMETGAERVERLDGRMQRAIRGKISEPGKYGDDCVQEGRIVLLEAAGGHADSWYITRCVWRAKDFVKKQVGRQRAQIHDFGFEIDAVDGEFGYIPTQPEQRADGPTDEHFVADRPGRGSHGAGAFAVVPKSARVLGSGPGYSPGYRPPVRDWRLWKRAGSIMAGSVGYSSAGRVQRPCTVCGRGHYRPGQHCPECVSAPSPERMQKAAILAYWAGCRPSALGQGDLRSASVRERLPYQIVRLWGRPS